MDAGSRQAERAGCAGDPEARLPWEDTDGRPGVWSLLAYCGDEGAVEHVSALLRCCWCGLEAEDGDGVCVPCANLDHGSPPRSFPSWLHGLSRWPPEALEVASATLPDAPMLPTDQVHANWRRASTRPMSHPVAVCVSRAEFYGESPTRTAISRALVAWALGHARLPHPCQPATPPCQTGP